MDVWSRHVGVPGADDLSLESLDTTERARAGRYRFQRDRDRFIARRTFLRRVLSGYLGVPPASIRYRGPGQGRPALDPPSPISFSTSHSEGLAVVAIGRDRLVGIDIELARPIPDALDLAHTLFARREADHLRSTPIDDRSRAFLRLWTRKEAYAKALGVGLSLPFDALDVLDDPTWDPGVGPAQPEALAVASIDAFPGYVAAVATSDADRSLEQVAVPASP